ncbi:hypothetical protein LAZ67_6003296 [Cordylochernes scorpioides]|uniref:Peptidase aspartic putative domain-containing protein n=1 Tax=Cordylochernes scorpioides TaxID=51811 RepID=A0ABY6KKH7_9ARAC|nr:hypothetical protein LAZ67_6003296 [Cordylochernes scorpioides]
MYSTNVEINRAACVVVGPIISSCVRNKEQRARNRPRVATRRRKKWKPPSEEKPLQNLTNSSTGAIYLQTLAVKASGPLGSFNVRAIFDTGSTRSYLSRKGVQSLGLEEEERVTLTHSLFGGGEVYQQQYVEYKVKLSGLKNNFTRTFTLLDHDVTCGLISPVNDDVQINELKTKVIQLTDVHQGLEQRDFDRSSLCSCQSSSCGDSIEKCHEEIARARVVREVQSDLRRLVDWEQKGIVEEVRD